MEQQQQQQQHAGDDGGGSRGRGRGRNPWTPSNEFHALRRPQYANATNSVNVAELNSMMNNTSMSDTVKNSELRVEAAEFVPRSYVARPQNQNMPWQRHGHSVQNRLAAARDGQQGSQHHHHHHHHHQNAYGGQHQYPYHVQQQMAYHQYGEPNHSYQRHDYGNYDRSQANHNAENSRGDQPLDVVLSQLNSAMQTLTRSPDQFDNLVVSLVCNITPHLKSKESTEQVVNAIIQKCIIDTNFRYSGARLCSHLDAVEVSTEEHPSIFRNCLFERCKTETQAQSVEWLKLKEHAFDDERKCHGLMLSLAELVAQMDTASILAKLLIDHISTTLKNPGPNSAKYICQSLKLAGQYLERDSTTNREEIEQVMRDLSDLVTRGQVDVHIGRMVNSVQELRSNNWGRGSSYRQPPAIDNNQSNVQNEQQQTVQPAGYDEPVLYGPDGMVLSAEERKFCQEIAGIDEGEDWVPGSENHQEEEDEDDIIAAAYEEFLKYSTPKNENPRGNRG